MKASELRKGCIVANDMLDIFKKGYVEVEARWIYELAVKESGQEYNKYVDAFIPIPLSEEWLLKMGFERCSCGGWKHLGKYKFHVEKDFTYKNSSILNIKVHQLQNLYFALTGEEITIKE